MLQDESHTKYGVASAHRSLIILDRSARVDIIIPTIHIFIHAYQKILKQCQKIFQKINSR